MSDNFVDLLKVARSAGQPCFVYLADSDESVVVLTLEEYKKFKSSLGITSPAIRVRNGDEIRDDLMQVEKNDFSPSKLIADLSKPPKFDDEFGRAKARPTKALAEIDEAAFDFENLDELDAPAGEELTAADVLRARAKKLSGNLKKKREGAFPGEEAEEW